ncbi:MAG TPA: PQQ-binding-like beta-propeller repeat protein [Candidatus Thermoplasmatota archaeon]|jgi:hypothetical protein|nr:PQQ-binding-like beta-propeller repeat protein [Candidatus Thermoplasmatota archaeon]
MRAGYVALGLVLAAAMAAQALPLDLLGAPGGEDPLYRGWGGDIAASPDGLRVFVTGRNLDGANQFDYKTTAFDAATGDELWTVAYDGPSSLQDWAIALAPSPRGDAVFVTGWSRDLTVTDMATVAYDARDGATQWAQRFHGPRDTASWTVGQDIAVAPDGQSVLVAGLALPPGTPVNAVSFDFITISYDAADGAQRWASWYNGPGNVEDWAYALAVSPDASQAFVTGRSYSGVAKKWDYGTVAYDARDGREQWVARYDGPGSFPASVPYALTVEEWANGIVASPDGQRVFVAGRSYDDARNYDMATLAYDARDGGLAWVQRYDGPAHLEDGGYAAAVHPSAGLVYVTGWSASEDADADFDYATVAYDTATGNRVWEARYGPSSALDDLALAVGVDPRGERVFVTGWSQGQDGSDRYATVAYDARTGAQLWEAAVPARLANNLDIAGRGNGPGNNLDLAALSVAPDGRRVYVTGTTDGPAGDNDQFAVAYDAATGAEVWRTASEQGPAEAKAPSGELHRTAAQGRAATPGAPLLLAGALVAAVALCAGRRAKPPPQR